jgi:hypothetical protein
VWLASTKPPKRMACEPFWGSAVLLKMRASPGSSWLNGIGVATLGSVWVTRDSGWPPAPVRAQAIDTKPEQSVR